MVGIWFFVALLALPAAARNWRIADFHSTVNVRPDGEMVISERIAVVFEGSFQGIYRSIPVEYPGPHGSNYTLLLEVLSVTGDDGQALRYESKYKRGTRELKIYVPGASDTTRHVVITYVVQNGLRYFDTHDELYWNVTGNDWPVPIDHASAWVSFPDKAAGVLRAQAFTGVYGSVEREAAANVQGSRVEFETTNPLPMRGGLTINVYLPKGIVAGPGALRRALWFLRSNGIVLMPLVAFGVMFGLWWVKGRDPDPGHSVAPLYEPPKDLTPAEAGLLLDDRIDPRDITSTLIDLAVRGYIRIEEVEEEGFFWNKKEYLFHRLKPESDGLAAHESVMLANLFSGGQTTRLSDLKNKFYTAVPVIRHDILAALKRKGMYRVDPNSAQAYRFLGVVLVAAPFVALDVLGVTSFFESPVLAVVSIVLSLIIVLVIGHFMTAKTVKGARARVAVLGFQEFINRVEADRLRRMPPDTFEKFLPYAMALGVEQRWAQAFANIAQQPPNWYSSTQGRMFNPILFTNNMHAMSTQAFSAFTAAPRSSSSGRGFGGGGFSSGGGFSGGGFGGGGGGAF